MTDSETVTAGSHLGASSRRDRRNTCWVLTQRRLPAVFKRQVMSVLSSGLRLAEGVQIAATVAEQHTANANAFAGHGVDGPRRSSDRRSSHCSSSASMVLADCVSRIRPRAGITAKTWRENKALVFRFCLIPRTVSFVLAFR